MSVALTVHLPNSLHRELTALAEAEGISLNQFLMLAAAEKMSALRTIDYLKAEAHKGNRANFEYLLAAVPDAEPEKMDRLP